jgi:hypothetical protein
MTWHPAHVLDTFHPEGGIRGRFGEDDENMSFPSFDEATRQQIDWFIECLWLSCTTSRMLHCLTLDHRWQGAHKFHADQSWPVAVDSVPLKHLDVSRSFTMNFQQGIGLGHWVNACDVTIAFSNSFWSIDQLFASICQHRAGVWSFNP